MPNRLTEESSPYLKQHSENPVDWYAWGPEALARSKDEDRPILLSVGYSSCHWCHVMERESFEDPVTAGLMNKLFVNVKVDREERPDLDQIYMKAVQAMTGRGGWPMTVFLTPEGIPFFGGTYYPPEPQPGMPSFTQVLQAVADAWENRRDEVRAGGIKLLEALQRTTGSGGAAGEEVLEKAFQTLAGQYDARHGGFGSAPKFPQPVTLELLLRHHLRTGDASALEMAIHTLRRMAAGGMRDHIGGGFHRYSVDQRWLVPHFEKMLYDNALLARAYLNAFRLTDSDDLRDVLVHTLDYLAADMRAPEGGFYSARDADSEGEEGLFYVWTPAEIEDELGADEARLFCRVYDITEEGNFEGRSIAHLPHEISAIAKSEELNLADVEQRLASARTLLLERRAQREAPFLDQKVIVSWNAMTIRAFAAAGATLGRPDYVDIATGAADFLWAHLHADGRLFHSWIDGTVGAAAFLDDHAGLGNALLDLHAATLDPRWLDRGFWLCEEILERFYDVESGLIYDTASDAEELIVRPRDPMDNATPSGPSLAAELLARAGKIKDESRYLEVARAIVDREAEALERFGPAFGRMLSVLDRLQADSVEIVIIGGSNDETAELVCAAHADLLPNSVIIGRREGDVAPDLPLLQGREQVDGRATAYVCRNFSCRLPVTDAGGLRSELRAT